MTAGLVEWLREQLDEDERIARATTAEHWGALRRARGWSVHPTWQLLANNPDPVLAAVAGPVAEADAVHMAWHDPAWVLRDVEAKRRILDDYRHCLTEVQRASSPTCTIEESGAVRAAFQVAFRALKRVASVYCDRPGYRQEWAS